MPVATETPSKSTSTGLTPERSLDQRRQALKRANVVRTRRANLKRDVKAGRIRIQTLLLNPPEYLLTAKVQDFLMEVPKYGKVKTSRVFKACRVSPSKTFGGL